MVQVPAVSHCCWRGWRVRLALRILAQGTRMYRRLRESISSLLPLDLKAPFGVFHWSHGSSFSS